MDTNYFAGIGVAKDLFDIHILPAEGGCATEKQKKNGFPLPDRGAGIQFFFLAKKIFKLFMCFMVQFAFVFCFY